MAPRARLFQLPKLMNDIQTLIRFILMHREVIPISMNEPPIETFSAYKMTSEWINFDGSNPKW